MFHLSVKFHKERERETIVKKSLEYVSSFCEVSEREREREREREIMIDDSKKIFRICFIICEVS